MSKKRILFIGDTYRLSTGYSTVISNIMLELLKDGNYEVAQLGLADRPVDPNSPQIPIKYYATFKDHSRCCGRGQVIEYYDHANKTYDTLTPNLTVDSHPSKGFCPNGAPMNQDGFGQESCFFVIQHFKPDMVIAVNDVWGLYHLNL